jgi:hypothetical protein
MAAFETVSDPQVLLELPCDSPAREDAESGMRDEG